MDQQVPNIVMGTPSPPRLLHWPRTQHSRHSGQCEDNIVIGWPRGGGIHLNAWSYGQIRCEMKYICTDTVPNVINSSITSSTNHFIKTSTLILHFRIRNNYHFLYFSSGQLLTACRPPTLANIRLENLSLNIDQISENQIKINHSKQENNY